MMLGKLLSGFKGHDRDLAWNRSDAAAETLRLTSPAFANGTPMPRRFAGTGVGANLSPPLTIEGVPPGTQDLFLVLQDPDVPLPAAIVHMIARLMPVTRNLPEGALNAGQPIAFGKASFGSIGYQGPRPIPGHGPHRYVFQLFAVSRPLNLGPKAKLADYLEVMKGHILARGRLTGTYER